MSRETVLDQWLHAVLGSSDFQRVPLSNDASFRKYYRVFHDETSYVVMDAPPPENSALFCEVAELLKSKGIHVPTVLHNNVSQGFLVLSDFGDRIYLKELNQDSAHSLYQDAFAMLLKIQHCQGNIPSFDPPFLSRQMDIFKEWYLKRHLKIEPAVYDKILGPINALLEQLTNVIELQPRVFVHRDYHSRNLMRVDHQNPGVLDFQDAMFGPITYDLVSLLQDCYIAWPRSTVEGWVRSYQNLATEAGLLSDGISRREFLRWFDLTGLQRHLKNLGIFSRLYYRDGKSHYLNDIPLVRRYISETVSRYQEELKPFSFLFEIALSDKDPSCVL